MFKKIFLAFCLLCLFSSAYASIYLISPHEEKLDDGAITALGSVAKGETLSIIVSKRSDLGFEWDAIKTNEGLLPQDWSVAARATDKSLILQLKIPANAESSTQRLEIQLTNNSQPYVTEQFFAIVTVKELLLNASMEGLKQETTIGNAVKYKLTINNQSIAEHNLIFSSTLPNYWFQPLQITAQPKKVQEFEIVVYPAAYGMRSFDFTLQSEMSDVSFSFHSALDVYPTLKGEYTAPLFGLPFFNIPMLPYYMITSMLAALS
jgi:hypothetical protein